MTAAVRNRDCRVEPRNPRCRTSPRMKRPTVQTVRPGSAAAGAGLQAGDEFACDERAAAVIHRGRQLGAAPHTGNIPLTLRRAGKELSLNLPLPAGWRSRTDIS